MLVYHYDANGLYTGSGVADESPLEPGVFLVPAFSTTQAPPKTTENSVAVFSDAGWSLVEVEDKRIKFERAWRDNELRRADIQLNKVQDGDGVGSVADWRKYRSALRRWPESKDFPVKERRPVAPDSVID